MPAFTTYVGWLNSNHFDSFETVIHTFISTRLDYCNSLYIWLPLSSISKSLTPVLHSLHWLPVWYWIDLNILVFIYKALRNQSPKYFSDLTLLDHLDQANDDRMLIYGWNIPLNNVFIHGVGKWCWKWTQNAQFKATVHWISNDTEIMSVCF